MAAEHPAALARAFSALREDLIDPARFRRYYVHTESGATTRLAPYLQMAKDGGLAVLTGPRGAGKSTELARLVHVLRDDVAGIHVPFRQWTDRRDPQLADLVVGILGASVLWAVHRSLALDTGPGRPVLAFLNEAAHAAGRKPGGQAGIDASARAVQDALRTASGRGQVRTYWDAHRTDADNALAALEDATSAALGIQPLVAVDDMDLFGREVAGALLESVLDMQQPPYPVVLTASASVMHTRAARALRDSSARIVHQEPAATKNGSGELRELIDLGRKRVPDGAVDQRVLEGAAQLSGGLPGMFLRLLAESCVRARSAGKATLDRSTFDSVAGEVRTEEWRGLRTEDIDRLKAVADTGTAPTDPILLDLLDDGRILERPGEPGRYDVLPLLGAGLTTTKAVVKR